MQILEAERVTKYFGGLAAVHNVDFSINQGEILGLIGPNGAGKTTLFNLISGALALTSGVARFKGEKITGLKPNQICSRGIARTFQLIKLFGNMTVFENVLMGSLFGMSKRVRKPDAERESLALLEFVGLSNIAWHPARELNVANQKRLEVARALATKPDLLLLDATQVFASETEVTFTDAAHLTQLGRELLTQAIGERLIEGLDVGPQEGSLPGGAPLAVEEDRP